MYSKLGEAIIEKNREEISNIISNLEKKDINLTNFVDEFASIMLMEANLSFGNFHFIKMALFLRELAIKNYFSKKTEQKLINLLSLNMTERHFVKVEASRIGYKEEKADQTTIKKMVEELDKGNSHNAYYYSLGLLKYKPEVLRNNLLVLGTESLSKSLGHSFTCFYPVVKDLMVANSRHDTNSLLSYILYLSRFDYDKKVHIQYDKDSFKNVPHLMEVCSSGEGIVNLHHMITLAMYLLWEKDNIYGDYIPYKNFINWVGNKGVDQKQKEKVEKMEKKMERPENYQDFENLFSLSKLEESLPLYYELMEKDYKTAVEWMFRLYTIYYNPNWDPHYFTSLYSALKLFKMDQSEDKIPSKMAIYQALKYFSQRVEIDI
ncbi:MAG: hypothetical protein R6V14_02490 [Halanaerobiales bacterium]